MGRNKNTRIQMKTIQNVP